MIKTTLVFVSVIALFVIGSFVISHNKTVVVQKPVITNFEECVRDGRPVMETYPRQCRDDSGHVFAEVVEAPVTPPVSDVQNFSTEYLLNIGGHITLPDGLTVTLKKVNDSRCPKGVTCVWAGELAPVLSVTGGYFGTAIQEVIIGTVRNQSDTTGGYTFAIRSATTTSANIVVYRGISK